MAYDSYETSVSNGSPVELYLFSYNGTNYTYTSCQIAITANINGNPITFNNDYIKRDESLKLGSSSSSSTTETTKVTVNRTNNVALLYQGAPPEEDNVTLSIYRYHIGDESSIIRLVYGKVTSVTFRGSEAELTIIIENMLRKSIPRGTLSYYCQNCIYDNKCKLNEDDWKTTCYVDSFNGLRIHSPNLTEKPSGYYTDGMIKMGTNYRSVVLHADDYIDIKYPINESEIGGSFNIWAGCNSLFLTCASRFNNTTNFSGVPYCKPINAVRNRTGYGAYWIDSTAIKRDSDGFMGTISGV